MPTILQRLAGLARLVPAPRAPEGKTSAVAPLVALQYQRQPVWTPREYAGFAREGFTQNPVVYRCVRMIAEAAASIRYDLFAGDREVTAHPLLDLLARPNPLQCGTELLEAWYGYLLVSGNAYMEAVGVGAEVRELYALRPDRISIVPGTDGWPAAYEYSAGGGRVSLSGEAAPGVRTVLHQALFHPANDHYGLSPIEAAATAIDIHNAASAWNKAMLDNAALPSGALVYTAADRQLTSEQYARLKSELEASFQGARNAGRPMLLEGGLDWRAMSMSPKDMDFIESKRQAARDIALALGVPPMLLGIPGDNTYSNYQEANRSFWRHTVLPLATRSLRMLSGWLAPAWDGGLELRPDLDTIEALAPERDALWARIGAAAFLTDAEKRAAVGYDGADAGGAEAKLFNPSQPRVPAGSREGGRWTSGGGGGIASSNAQSDAVGGGPSLLGGPVTQVASKTLPAPPNLAAAGVTTLELPFGDVNGGMAHIIDSHSPMGSNTAGKSVFDSLVIPNFDDFLRAGLPGGFVRKAPPGSIEVEVRAILEIGSDRMGQRTHDFLVVLFETAPGGYSVITAYPIPDGTAGMFRR